MKQKKYILMALLLIFTSMGWAKVDPEADSQELTYEDLLGELKSRQSNMKKDAYHPYDDLLIHMGVGFVTTFSSLSVMGQSKSVQQSGLELSVGADLFSNQWYTEGTFRNYGVESNAREEISVKQLDFKIGFREQLQKPWAYHLGAGISTRSLKYSSVGNAINLEETSPAFLGFMGVEAQVSPFVSFGFEIGGRSPFSSSLDRGSLEMGLILGLSI